MDVLRVEYLKLRRSLVLLLCAAAPTFVALISLLLLLDSKRSGPWSMFVASAAALWGYFMLPMTVTALTILLAQIEHGPRAWNQMLALPVPRWRLFAAKTFVVLSLVGIMTLLLYGLIFAAGAFGEAVKPGRQFVDGPAWAFGARTLATMFAGALAMIAIQLWAALRFRSFVPPLVLGIGGTFAAVAATTAKQGIYFPWLIPVNVLASDPDRVETAILIGAAGGVILFGLMLLHLGRYEAP